MICDLFKNKGSPALIQSYRDILLMDDDGKGVQRLVRKRLFPIANAICVDSQFGGGLNGGETAFCAQGAAPLCRHHPLKECRGMTESKRVSPCF